MTSITRQILATTGKTAHPDRLAMHHRTYYAMVNEPEFARMDQREPFKFSGTPIDIHESIALGVVQFHRRCDCSQLTFFRSRDPNELTVSTAPCKTCAGEGWFLSYVLESER